MRKFNITKNTFSIFILTFFYTLVSCQQTETKKENDETISIKKDSVIFENKKEPTSKGLTIPDIHLDEFIPKGYSVLDTAIGDLNLDTLIDLIIILKKNEEEKTSDVIDHPEKRPLLILIEQPDKSFKVIAKNNNAVYCYDCGGIMGDPYMNVVINKGEFYIEHYGGSNWRWTRTITFKYSSITSKWLLYKDVNESFHTSEPDSVKTKTYTPKDFGEIHFEKFDIYKEE